MTQSFVVNGKEYLPSTELAKRFPYTPDYIGKLAREEKVLGTLVGRQWFVEQESLRTFLAQAEIEKKLRAEDLRLKRKLEREAHEKDQRGKMLAEREHEFIAFGQSVVVVLCGLLIGTLGFVSVEEDLGVQEFSVGIEKSVVFVAESFIGDAIYVASDPVMNVAASAESAGGHKTYSEEQGLVFTNLPEFPPREFTASSTQVHSGEARVIDFSDEVNITTNEDGSTVIVPVFREGEGERFLLMPLNAPTE